MSSKDLSGVEDTLFIPLMARIYVSKRFPEYFYDEKALNLESSLPTNRITEKSSEYAMMGSASRAVNMDKIVTEFIQNNEKSNVICIGCGLETMAFRLAELSDKVHFYEVDFSHYLDCTLPIIFVVAGVFQYFKEYEVLSLITKMQNQFSSGEILFDATDEFGIKYVNKYVKKTGNKNAMMYFYINDPKEFADKAKMKLISASGFYGEISKGLRKKLKLYTRIATKIADRKMHAMILRFKL